MGQTYIDQLEHYIEMIILDPEMDVAFDFLNDAYKDLQYGEKTIICALDDFLSTEKISKREYLILFLIYIVCAEKYKEAMGVLRSALLLNKKERELCCLFLDENRIMSDTIRGYLERVLNQREKEALTNST